MLGATYYFGEGVDIDFKLAVDWYKKSAKQGHPKAQFNLGSAYWYGKGVPKDPGQTYMWWTLAGGNGYALAKEWVPKIAPHLTATQIVEAKKLAEAQPRQNAPNAETKKPVKELTPEEKTVVGTYEFKIDEDTFKTVFLENGVYQGYANGKKKGKECKWKAVDGELHIYHEEEGIEVFRINNDGNLTGVAGIGIDGKRTELPKEEQLTLKKIKSETKEPPSKQTGITPSKIIPQARPIFALLEAVKNSDQKQLKTVFCEMGRKEFEKEGWGKVLAIYQEYFKKAFGDYKLEDFTFEYKGFEGEDFMGMVSITRKGKKFGELMVIKESAVWKMAER